MHQLTHHPPHLTPTNPPLLTPITSPPPVVDPRGHPWHVSSLWPKIFSISCSFLENLAKSYVDTPEHWHPSYGESCIYPWPLGTNPSSLGQNQPSAIASSSTSASASASASTRELEIIQKFLYPTSSKCAKFKNLFYHVVVVEYPHYLTCHYHWSSIHFWAK